MMLGSKLVKVRLTLASLAVLWLTLCTAHGQGTTFFSNGGQGNGVYAPVFLQGTGYGPGPDFSAELALVNSNVSLTPLVPTTTFRSGVPNPVASEFVFPISVVVPGVMPGERGTFVMRVWETALGSYDGAVKAGSYFGESEPITIQVGPENPVLSSLLNGLMPFTVAVPEPTVLTLAFAGAALIAIVARYRSR
jgi:hypothetical protein